MPMANTSKSRPSDSIPSEDNSIECILVDISTLLVNNGPVPGAAAVLNSLRHSNVDIFFLTESTTENMQTIYKTLHDMGFVKHHKEIRTNLSVMEYIIETYELKPMILLAPRILKDYAHLSCKRKEKIDSVIIGFATELFNYHTLNEAFNYIRKGAQFITLYKNKFTSGADHLSLGPSFFTDVLEIASRRTANHIGMASDTFFNFILADTSPKRTIVITDNFRFVEGIHHYQMNAYLVQTGRYKSGDENLCKRRPTAVCTNVVEALDSIKTQFLN